MTASNIRRLRDLPAGCFEGVIPTALATCASDGTPNATWISQVFLVDDRTVALSCQFFRKTRQNLASQKVAQLLVVDPLTLAQWRLQVIHVGTETSGPTFEKMKARVDAIASSTGMTDVFRLASADLFEVLAVEPVSCELPDDPAPPPPLSAVDALETLSRFSESVAASSDLADVIESGLGFLATQLGYESVGLYVLEDSERALYTLASRGFPHSGVGARVPLGVGVVGACAERRLPIRIADTRREMLYGRAVREQAERANAAEEREIPVPGLPEARSVLAVPLLLRGKLFGVLATESRTVLAFSDTDAKMLSTAGQMLAQAIALDRDEGEPAVEPTPAKAPRGTTRVRYYEEDDSVFVDDEYVIKGIPGRILWLVLTLREQEGRSTFSNRELRLHPALKLPAYKDNLETRLLMLQRRLEEKSLALKLIREQRGRLTLACETAVELERVAGGVDR